MFNSTLILEIGIALLLVAIVGLLANRLRFSLIPFFIITGMVLGQHAPTFGPIDLTFAESMPFIDFMGRLGVLFLLFYLGMEFSIGRILKSQKSVVTGGVTYVLLNFFSGVFMGWVMDLPFREMMVLCGIMTSSSTAIVAKVITDLKRTANPETEVIMGMIMLDDLFIAMHISFLSGLLLAGEEASLLTIASSSVIALVFIVVFLFLGRKLVPSIDRLLQDKSSELFVLIIFSLLFVIAGVSETIHVAEAIGALMVGLVFAESKYIRKIETMVLPYKDFFGAMFFFSFGLSVDMYELGGAAGWAVMAAIITVFVNVAAGYFATKSAGLKSRNSVDIGFVLSSRGEFSIIMANIGKAAGLLPILQSFVVVYVLVLSAVSPLLTKQSKSFWDAMFRTGGAPPAPQKKKLSDLEALSAKNAENK